jgi:hypothetical protein
VVVFLLMHNEGLDKFDLDVWVSLGSAKLFNDRLVSSFC